MSPEIQEGIKQLELKIAFCEANLRYLNSENVTQKKLDAIKMNTKAIQKAQEDIRILQTASKILFKLGNSPHCFI